MTTTRRFFPLLACACIWLAALPLSAQTPPHQAVSLEKWTVSTAPREDTTAWYAVNRASEEWQVYLQNGSVAVRPFRKRVQETIPILYLLTQPPANADPQTTPGTSPYAKNQAIRVADGWILFTNHGEWGGRVDWFSPDGTRHYKISNDQIAAYTRTNEGLFAIQGLAHLSLSFGTLIKLEQDTAGKWKARTVVDLKDAPYASLPEAGGTFLVVTSSKLLRVNVSARTVTPLLEKTFWSILYPNSLVAAPNGDLYIGMRGGVARAINSRGVYHLQWLTQPAR